MILTRLDYLHVATLLAAMFLRGVGIVGHSKQSVAQDEKCASKEELKRDQDAEEDVKTEKSSISADAPTLVN